MWSYPHNWEITPSLQDCWPPISKFRGNISLNEGNLLQLKLDMREFSIINVLTMTLIAKIESYVPVLFSMINLFICIG